MTMELPLPHGEPPGIYKPNFWDLHKQLGQCYKEPSAHSEEEEESAGGMKLDSIFDPPSPKMFQAGCASPTLGSQKRHERKKMSKTEGTLDDGNRMLWASRNGSMNQGLSLAQMMAGPRQISLSRNISAPAGRQVSVDFNDRVVSTSDIGSYMSHPAGGAVAAAERAKSSWNTRMFVEDRYADDRKVAFDNIPKLEAAFARKVTSGPSALTSLADSHESSKFGSELDLFQSRSCFMMNTRASQRQISADAGLRTQGSKLLRDMVTQKSKMGCDGKQMVMTPGGISRAVWDALRMICVFIDIVVIPLRFFDSPILFGQKVHIVSVLGLIFWSVDILVSFRTGYFEKGILVMSSRKIAWHYLKRWFLFDICVVVLDCILLGVDGFAPVETLPHSIQVLQVIRMIRVGRLLKWNQMFASLRERFDSQYWVTQMSIVNIIIQILLMYHVVGCIFFGLGKLNTSEVSWIETYGLKDAEFGYQYTTTLHWALCQLGMGSNIIEATNLVERLFGIAAVLFAIITFSSLVSLMTSLLTSLHNAREEELHQFRLLKSFLVRNQIPGSLSQRVKNFLQHSYTLQREAISETQVPLLSLLSKSLQGELQFARHQRNLSLLAFVSDALMAGDNLQHKDVAHDIADTAVSQTFLATSEVVFYAGNVAEHVFLATSGSLLYLQGRGKAEASTDLWIAEMCLWTPWAFVGDLVTQDLTVLVMVEQSSFCDCVCKSPDTQKVAKLFAEDYVANMNHYTVSSDLWQYPGDEDDNLDRGRQWMSNLFGGKNQKRRNSIRRASEARISFDANVAEDVVPGANGLPGLDSQGLKALQQLGRDQ